jgi:hypothetical protein
MRFMAIGLLATALGVAAAGAADLRSELATLEVGKVLHDEAMGMTFRFLQKFAGEAGEDGWGNAKSQGCGFAVRLPAPFQELEQQAPATDGAKLTFVVLGSHTEEGAKFTVMCTRRSDDTFRDDFVAATLAEIARKNEVLERREVARGGRTFAHLSFRGRDSLATLELARLGNAAYQLTVEVPLSEAPALPTLSERFFASFEP